ncbi:hypothetical protein YPPY52_3144, partial [Yersinia pestis PY-52]
MKLQRYSLLSL